MKIVLASSEVVPFAKTGGLADVTGALPGELARLGHEITVFMPAYRCVAEQFELERTEFEFEIPVGDHPVKGRLKKTLVPKTDVVVYLVDHPEFFDRPGILRRRGNGLSRQLRSLHLLCPIVVGSDSIVATRCRLDSLQRLANEFDTGAASM